VHPLPILAHIAFDRGDTAYAQTCHDKLVVGALRYETPTITLDLASIGARLALLNNDPLLARKRFSLSLDKILSDKIVQRRAYCLAIHVAIDLASNKASQRAVNALEQTHIVSRRNLHQTFAATVLYRALKRLNRRARAEILLREYSDQYRRETWPIPSYLLDPQSID